MPFILGRNLGPRLHELVTEEDCTNLTIECPPGDIVRIKAEYVLNKHKWEMFVRSEMALLELERKDKEEESKDE